MSSFTRWRINVKEKKWKKKIRKRLEYTYFSFFFYEYQEQVVFNHSETLSPSLLNWIYAITESYWYVYWHIIENRCNILIGDEFRFGIFVSLASMNSCISFLYFLDNFYMNWFKTQSYRSCTNPENSYQFFFFFYSQWSEINFFDIGLLMETLISGNLSKFPFLRSFNQNWIFYLKGWTFIKYFLSFSWMLKFNLFRMSNI